MLFSVDEREFKYRNPDVSARAHTHAHALGAKDTDSAAVWKPEASVSDSSASLVPDSSSLFRVWGQKELIHGAGWGHGSVESMDSE